MFSWDNKGTISVWDKSTSDWAILIWLAVASIIVWLGVAKCSSLKYKGKFFLYLLCTILFLHALVVIFTAKNEAIYYLGIPHLFLALGIYIWWFAIENTDKTKEP